MHLAMIALTLAVAVLLRWHWQPSRAAWTQRWAAAWRALVLPPVCLLATAIAILAMGWRGTMFHIAVGWWSYGLAAGFGLAALLLAAIAALQGWQADRQVRRWPEVTIAGEPGRLLPTSLPFAALVGCWSPELVVSQGLLDRLAPEQVAAAIAHERAHLYYRDTLQLCWLGWLRRLTAWLPRSEALWQELLLLRELRADAWAARHVDPLLLAETLLQVVQEPALLAGDRCAALSDSTAPQRLAVRVDALLAGSTSLSESIRQPNWWLWGLALLPLLAALGHH